MAKHNIGLITRRLAGAYGIPAPNIRSDPVAVLIRTILSQNTSDKNSLPAYDSLVSRFHSREEIARASTGEIAAAIKQGGLSTVKAGYIKDALLEINRKQGSMDLGFLTELGMEQARQWLLHLPGVGLKTANCVLLFALGMPALPVDTHVFRVSTRLGLIDNKINIDRAHRLLEEIVPPEEVYKFHILLIEHGRRTCKAHNPGCMACVLTDICNYVKLMDRH